MDTVLVINPGGAIKSLLKHSNLFEIHSLSQIIVLAGCFGTFSLSISQAVFSQSND